jgi:hypothetical protein
LRDSGFPALREAARQLGRPVPSLCPRIQVRLASRRVQLHDRAVGTGTLDQIEGDLDELAELGAEYVLLGNPDDPHDPRPVAEDWRILERVADRSMR